MPDEDMPEISDQTVETDRVTDLTEATNALLRETAELRKSARVVTRVRDEILELRRIGSTNRRLVILSLLGAFVALALIVSLIVISVQLRTVSNRLDAEVTTQKVEALCPLYQIFITADTPANRAAAEARGDDMVYRDKAFGTIHRSYDVLRCKDFIGSN